MAQTGALMGVTGGPVIRPQSNMPTSMLLRMGGKTILVDAGLGVTRGICDQGVALTEIDMIFITHLHSDHYLELGPLFHTALRAVLNLPIPVIGPDGLDAYWAGFQASMAFDIELRMRDEGRCAFGALAEISPMPKAATFDEIGVASMLNKHPPIAETYALRFDAMGQSVVLSGDTAYMPEMAEFARGADLLVLEAMLRDGVEALCARMTNGYERLRTHILNSHTVAVDVGRIAADAGVKQLALNHFVPDGDPAFTDDHWRAAVRQHWSGPLHLGTDGLVIAL